MNRRSGIYSRKYGFHSFCVQYLDEQNRNEERKQFIDGSTSRRKKEYDENISSPTWLLHRSAIDQVRILCAVTVAESDDINTDKTPACKHDRYKFNDNSENNLRYVGDIKNDKIPACKYEKISICE